MRIIAFLKNSLLDLVFPLFCAGCLTKGTLLCPRCRSDLWAIPPACFVCKALVPRNGTSVPGATCAPCRKKSLIRVFLSPFSYDSPVIRNLIHRLKYQRAKGVAPILGRLLHEYLRYQRIDLPSDALLVPIPLHRAKERSRGFNQAFLIAQELGMNAGIAVSGHTLKKTKQTRPQMELRREERIENLAGCFQVSDRTALRNRTIVLLDDVKTTGTTLQEAARTLRVAGAKKIWAITVAH
ncbi:MAG: ComF family protein [Candidatus Sungbacteria bacterium]|uniref:ComF family protein n=1 Tax=Candidatus Sungiibacteriota bacterium TaxID=2750080 RepID=A0A932R035_9BACT|nr:ComF family protein [Candidatus Sungbacteria bacterium]